jgi:anti-sigma regulatory factor (Ser/Thr protein kinase)
VVTNIVDCALREGGLHEIRICPDVRQQAIAFEVTDEGRPFNILEAEPRALPGLSEDSVLGGHGIRLIRRFADEIRYDRSGGMNRLTLGFRTSDTSQEA